MRTRQRWRIDLGTVLTSKLPPGTVRCDECRTAEVTLVSASFDDLWKEVHQQHGWMLQGAGRRSWRLLCPACQPHGDPGALGPRGGAGG
jgi:hypothetical protein